VSADAPQQSYDCVVVGAGPGGLSAALMLGRCRRKVLVCDIGEPRNIRAAGLHSYLTRDGTRPAEFLDMARQEVARYPSVVFRRVEVLDATRSPDGFRIVCADGLQVAAR
jgi:thioredoxin reductase